MYSIAIFMKQYIWKTILAANKLGNIIYYHERHVLFQHLLTTYWLLRHYLDTKLKLSTWFSFCNFVRDINILLIILNFNAWPLHWLYVIIFSFIFFCTWADKIKLNHLCESFSYQKESWKFLSIFIIIQ